MNEVLKILYERRSLRRFAEKPIPEDSRDNLLHAAMRAPSAGNLMSYSVIDVTDQEIKEQLVHSCDNQPMIAQAPMVLVFLADMQRLYDYFRYCGVPELCQKEGLPYTTPGEGDFLLAANDAIVAAQNVVIAAESMGMGSCYIGDIIENIEIHRELLALPRWTFPVAMLILGYPPDNENTKPVSRFPTRLIVHRNRYRTVVDEEFDEMFSAQEAQRPAGAPYIEPATNLGQHIYIRKFASDFMAELRRSFEKGLREWTTPESGGEENMNGQRREDLKPGLAVAIVLKRDQATGRLTEGVVADILTNSAFHPHGIKVRLTDGQVGRVKEVRES